MSTTRHRRGAGDAVRRTTRKRFERAAASIAIGSLMLVLGSPAEAFRLRTRRLIPGPAGSLLCAVVNLSGKPLQISARIMSRFHGDVTDSLYTKWVDDTDVLAEYAAGSYDDDGRYCKITVEGGTRGEVSASFTLFDADGMPVTTLAVR